MTNSSHQTGDLKGKTLFVTGASRGIGLAIALRAARDGANVAVVAKTVEPHPKLPGTIYTAAKEIEEAGGNALPIQCDIRNDEQVKQAIDQTVSQFGGIDILINNASAISLTGILDTEMKRFDLMQDINARGTFLCSKLAVPHLKKASNPHILTLSPPINLQPKWFARHIAYTISKYGMTMVTLGLAEELKPEGIAANTLWPETAIDTAAVRNLLGGTESAKRARKPEIVADAAHWILTRDASSFTGNFCIDSTVILQAGRNDLSVYAVDPVQKLLPDFFLG